MRKITILFLTIAMIHCLATEAMAGKDYGAKIYEVYMDVQPGGALQITERFTFWFEGGPFSFVSRKLPAAYTDGIQMQSFSLDGRDLGFGTEPGQVEVTGKKRIKITWHLPSIYDSIHSFEFSYRVGGALRKTDQADLLFWQALPTEYDYLIDTALVVVHYPQDARIISIKELRGKTSKISATAGEIRYEALRKGPNSSLLIKVAFKNGSLIASPPEWQRLAIAQLQWFPHILGLSIIAIFLGVYRIIVQARRSPRRRFASGRSMATVTAPPGPESSMIAAQLAYPCIAVNAQHQFALLFELAQRGIIEFEQLSGKRRASAKDFMVRLKTNPADAPLHQKVLLENIFGPEENRVTEIRVKDLVRKMAAYSKTWSRLNAALREEMDQAGFYSLERKKIQNGIIRTSVYFFAATVVAILLAIIFWNQAGPYAIIFPFSLVILGIVGLIIYGVYSTLSDKGFEQGLKWRGFASYLREIIRGKKPISYTNELFGAYLPHAVAFSLGPQWAKAFLRKGLKEVPSYFIMMEGAGIDNMTSFMAFTAFMSSTTSSGGVGGAAGAGGGGASGAG